MKKILVALLILAASAASAHAEKVAFQFAGGKFIVPFKTVDLTQLYNFKEGRGYVGADVTLYEKGRYQWGIGAAPVIGTSANVPYFAVQRKLPSKFFEAEASDVRVGLWAGKPSDKKAWAWGVKASVPLW